MEKIYMEKNDRDKSFFRKIKHSSFSVKCSFMLAIVTMFSVVFTSFSGMGGSSYALPDLSNDLPDTFTTAETTGNFITLSANDPQNRFKLQPFYTSGGIQVFCLEHDIDFGSGITYKKGEAIKDYGLLYLMANSYPNKKFLDSSGNELAAPLQTWITQVAIWAYLSETGIAHNTFTELENIKNSKATSVYDNDGTYYANAEIYSTYIAPLVEDAKKHKIAPVISLDASIENDIISLDSEEKYYQSSLITVAGSPSDNFNSYFIRLENYPKGTLVVDEDGNTISKGTNVGSTSGGFTSDDSNIWWSEDVAPNTKFYLKVPVSEVTEENKTIKVSIVGSFSSYKGNYYTGSIPVGTTGNVIPAQTITSVGLANVYTDTGIDVTFNYTPEVPDTKMNVSQTIYFIGLLIFLAGIGIVYANVLPKREQ